MGVPDLTEELRDEFRRQGGQTIPLRRNGTVEEVAAAALFLAEGRDIHDQRRARGRRRLRTRAGRALSWARIWAPARPAAQAEGSARARVPERERAVDEADRPVRLSAALGLS
ncbi:hypothetical protein ACWGH5_16190 [Streptomyces sp. NPDC054864]